MSTPKIKIFCSHCNHAVEKELKEYHRRKKLGKNHFFCGLSCSAKFHNSRRIVTATQKEKTKNILIERNQNSFPSRKGNFTKLLKDIRSRTKTKKQISPNIEMDLDEKYIQNIWDSQEGKCAITNIPLTMVNYKSPKNPYNVSIDRIDNNKWYIKGNIQLVCLFVNWAKNDFDNETISEIVQTIKAH